MKRIFFVIICAICVLPVSAITIEKKQIAELCTDHADKIDSLFSKIDLDHSGLAKVKAAWSKKDAVTACAELLKYYDTTSSGQWLRNPQGKESMCHIDPDKLLGNTFTFQGVEATVPVDPNGRLMWNYIPNGDYQWALFLNRHFHLQDLMNAYIKTKNTLYAKKINHDLRDWIFASPYSGKSVSYSDPSNQYQWRLLEVGCRAEVWPEVFYGMMDQLDSDVAILMLSSIADHGHCLRNYHAPAGNHLGLEIKGLTSLAAAFPEFIDSSEWLEHSTKIMGEQLLEQVYPDGVQKELTIHYGSVAFQSFYTFASLLRKSGKSVPDIFDVKLKKMLDYIARVQRPDGRGPLNNDSDLCFIRADVINSRDTYQNDEWDYINSNGQEGKKPKELSVFYPWAGQLVMRNGWDKNAHWAFFDMGPMGLGHWHYDKLHLSVAAYGRDLLVDSGRYTYIGYEGGTNPWRDYFIGTSSHNTIVVNGEKQNSFERVNDAPLENSHIITNEYDFARGTFANGYGENKNVQHIRAVTYLRDKYWVVVDRIKTDKPIKIDVFWHYHPDCNIIKDGNSVTSSDVEKANLRILPLSNIEWDISIVRGQENPEIQGWYSVRYNEKVPAPTAIYEAEIESTATFAWVLIPDAKDKPQIISGFLTCDSEDIVNIKLENSLNLSIPIEGDISSFRLSK